jgi:hypothetical protein
MNRTGDAVPTRQLASQLDIDVVILRWPEERDGLAALEDDERPRLLLVAPDASPPQEWDRRTDWIRLPADEVDIWTRVAMLQRRTRRRPAPHVDEFDVLWRGSEWVSLSAIDARLTRALLRQPGSVLNRRALAAAGWPESAPHERMVDSYVKRLRARLPALGLAIHTVRSRGYFLEVFDEPSASIMDGD